MASITQCGKRQLFFFLYAIVFKNTLLVLELLLAELQTDFLDIGSASTSVTIAPSENLN